ncbi:MAG: hypothetical protein M0002_15345 [Rhodospirillales bacterium]|nr:hypothetical protein [Rhodospirillales bacterium]
MRRALLIFVILALLALGAGFLSLGAFPPAPPRPLPVTRSIPNSTAGAG